MNNNLTFINGLRNYSLVKIIREPGKNEPFYCAIYQTKKGIKVFVKMWSGKVKDLNYYSLRNEIAINKLLHKVEKRNRIILLEKRNRVHTPQLLKVIESKSTLVMFLEYVDGKEATNVAEKSKISILLECIEYLHFIGSKLTPEEIKIVSKRSLSYYLFLYPALLAVAILRRPSQFKTLICGAFFLLLSLPNWCSAELKTLVHRDLHLKNILVSKNRIYLIDFQRCVYTSPLVEFATTLPTIWEDKKLRNQLLNYLLKNYINSASERNFFRGLIINFSTHGLTGNLPDRNIKRFMNFLKFGISQNESVWRINK